MSEINLENTKPKKQNKKNKPPTQKKESNGFNCNFFSRFCDNNPEQHDQTVEKRTQIFDPSLLDHYQDTNSHSQNNDKKNNSSTEKNLNVSDKECRSERLNSRVEEYTHQKTLKLKKLEASLKPNGQESIPSINQQRFQQGQEGFEEGKQQADNNFREGPQNSLQKKDIDSEQQENSIPNAKQPYLATKYQVRQQSIQSSKTESDKQRRNTATTQGYNFQVSSQNIDETQIHFQISKSYDEGMKSTNNKTNNIKKQIQKMNVGPPSLTSSAISTRDQISNNVEQIVKAIFKKETQFESYLDGAKFDYATKINENNYAELKFKFYSKAYKLYALYLIDPPNRQQIREFYARLKSIPKLESGKSIPMIEIQNDDEQDSYIKYFLQPIINTQEQI